MAKNVLSTSKFAPWNWFRHEEEKNSELMPKREFEHPMLRMHQEMDRLFDETFRSFGLPLGSRSVDPFHEDAPLLLRPSVDILEQDDAYRISVEVPGVKESDLRLEAEGDHLVVSGEKHQEDSSDEGKVHRVERRYGSFRRVLSLPQDANAQDISARFDNGVLTITVPRDKSQAPSGRHIPIEKT